DRAAGRQQDARGKQGEGSMHLNHVARMKWFAFSVSCVACAQAAASVAPPRPAIVHPGIDVLLSDSMALVRGKRIGFVTNIAAVDARGTSAVTRLRAAGLDLVALFAPEHGLAETAAPGEGVASSVDSSTNIPIYSLYGATVAPTAAMLAGIDVMVVDLPDVGARYYTYLATTVEVMQSAGARGIPVVVLDRPNPIGSAVQGNVLDPAFASMVGRLAVPMRHGLTLGEEARLAQSDLHLSVELHVVPAAGWRRDMLFEQTGLPFRPPSPNLQDIEALFDYPGTCLFEGTALSVGRGSDAPFRQIGAPWLDTAAVLARLRAARLSGVTFTAVSFTPHRPGDRKFADTTVAGIRLTVTDRRTFDPTRTAVFMLAMIRAVHPDRIRIGGSFDRLAGSPTLRTALLRGDPPQRIVDSWRHALAAYRRRVRPFLLYHPSL
ncbi:MAG: exo-beta-N-acetylmuramidase NamZ family protein, partial [Gemmatimonadales bacterium]